MQVIHRCKPYKHKQRRTRRGAQFQHKPYMGTFSPQYVLMLLLLGFPSLILIGVAQSHYDHDVSAETLNANSVTTFAVEDAATLTVSLEDTVNILSMHPTAEGSFDTKNIPVTVSTNNFFGYTLNMYAYNPISTSQPTTELTNTTATGAIATLDTTTTLADFESTENTATNNKWGYSLDGGNNFLPITEANMLIANKTTNGTTSAAGTDVHNVTFGVKLNNDVPNGTYEVSLNFVAIAEVPDSTQPESSFDAIFKLAGAQKHQAEDGKTYYAMQNMTTAICDYVYTPTATDIADTPTTQLVDLRDQKTYWVSKLADGKCWMTQNLDFDITGPLTSDTTNLTTTVDAIYSDGYDLDPQTGIITWTPTRNTYKVTRETTGANGDIGTGEDKWANNNFTPYSVDAGKWYENGTYFQSSECNDVNASTGCNFLDKTKDKATSGENLSNYFSKTPFQSNGEHGAVGNWYNWSAAVASNDTTDAETGAGTKQTNSICPKGWTLPYTKDTSAATSNEPGTYGNLNRLYNDSLETTDEGLFNSPFYGVRGGYIYTDNGLSTLYGTGRSGNYWSGTASTAANGYHLYLSSSYVNTAISNARSFGAQVRCVAL